MMDYELYDDNSDIPDDVKWCMVNNRCTIHYNSRPNYAIEVKQDEETYHAPYYGDQLLPAVS